MTTFSAIEAYRAELLAMQFTPIDDAEFDKVRRRGDDAHHSSAIEGIHPSDEQIAFDALMLAMRVPRDIARLYGERFLQERESLLRTQNADGSNHERGF